MCILRNSLPLLSAVQKALNSLQDLELPENLKALYKTVWEIKQRALVDMAADRGAYIDQSQSFNVHMSDPNFGKLTSLHFYGWKVGTANCLTGFALTSKLQNVASLALVDIH